MPLLLSLQESLTPPPPRSFSKRVTSVFPAHQALVERKVPKDPVVRLDLLAALVRLDLLAHLDLLVRKDLPVLMDLL